MHKNTSVEGWLSEMKRMHLEVIVNGTIIPDMVLLDYVKLGETDYILQLEDLERPDEMYLYVPLSSVAIVARGARNPYTDGLMN